MSLLFDRDTYTLVALTFFFVLFLIKMQWDNDNTNAYRTHN